MTRWEGRPDDWLTPRDGLNQLGFVGTLVIFGKAVGAVICVVLVILAMGLTNVH